MSKKHCDLEGNNPSPQLDIVLTNSIMFRQTVTGKHGMCPTWEEFVTKYAQNVLDAALRVVGNPDDADDVAQEVFMEIFKNNRMFQYSEQPALIRTIATRRALDRLRRKKQAIELNGRELDLRASDPYENIVAAELDQRLRDALVKVPPREAEIFCLSVFEGYSATEIAHCPGWHRNIRMTIPVFERDSFTEVDVGGGPSTLESCRNGPKIQRPIFSTAPYANMVRLLHIKSNSQPTIACIATSNY